MANTITLSPVKDTFVSAKYPSSNYSNSNGIRISPFNSADNSYTGYIGFDLSVIPSNKIITNIVFKIFFDSLYFERVGIISPPSNYINFQYVVMARLLDGFTVSELDNLTYNSVISKSDNPYVMQTNTNDIAMNVAPYTGSYISYPLKVEQRSEYIIGLLFNMNYTVPASDARFNFGSKEMGEYYEPKLVVTYDDYIPPKPKDLTPDNTIRNKAGSIRLSWKFEDPEKMTYQSTYTVEYTKDNFVTSTVVYGGINNYHDIPANTFLNDQTIKWRVKVTDSNGDITAYSEVATFTIGATKPSIPELIGPVNTIINSSDIVSFRWKFIDMYGYSQAKYDLQYKKASEIETTVSGTTAEHSLPQKALSGGDYLWRVRSYNQFNEVSDYSQWASFYSIGQPQNPTISSVSNNMHPSVTWTSVEQDLFVLKLYKGNEVIYESGEQPSGVEKQFTIPKFIENGTYNVGLKISNIYGFWSSEVFYTVIINVSKPLKPSIGGNINGVNVALIITTGTASNLIYRKGIKDTDYKLIANLINNQNTWIDYTVPTGDTSYYVISVSENGFNVSDVITITIDFNGIVLSSHEDYINLFLTKDSDKRPNIIPTKTKHLVYCNGRKYPLEQSLEYMSHSENHEYFIKKDEYDKLYRILVSEAVTYRNHKGYCFPVSVSNAVILEDVFGYITTFTLTRLEE